MTHDLSRGMIPTPITLENNTPTHRKVNTALGYAIVEKLVKCHARNDTYTLYL